MANKINKVTIFFGFLIFISTLSSFASIQKIKGVVLKRTEIFKSANFDSNIIGFLSKSDNIKISKHKIDPFYKVYLPNGKIGYVSDADVLPADNYQKIIKDRDKTKKIFFGESNSKKESNNEDSSFNKDSTVAIGINGGVLSFKNQIQNQKFSEIMPIYGLKLTLSPLIYKNNYGIEFNINAHQGVSNQIKRQFNEASGYYYSADMVLIFEFKKFQTGNRWIQFGFGPMYKKYELKYLDKDNEYQKIINAQFGLDTSLGFVNAFGKNLIIVEPKLYLENTTYWAIQLAYQRAF